MTRRFSAAIVALVFCLLPPSDWTVFSPLSRGSSARGRASLFASAESVTDSKIVDDENSTQSQPRQLSIEESLVEEKITFGQILVKAGKKGLGGGVPGAVAGVIQVLTLMGLRTIINYQMRYGTTFFKALDVLYKEGGIARFYSGLGFALIQAPLSRFVSTAANDGVLAFLSSFPATKDWGPGRTTMIGAIIVGIARMLLMPIDTCKTVLQVDSKDGFRNLLRRIRAGHFGVLYQGAIANAISSVMAHYPWFYTYNFLSSQEWLQRMIPSRLLQNASVGLVASVISDSFVNVFRVIKTTKQALGTKRNLSYGETIRLVLAADGWKGLFGRGLRTRIFANALQSIVFTIIWRGLADRWGKSRVESMKDEHEAVAAKELARELHESKI